MKVLLGMLLVWLSMTAAHAEWVEPDVLIDTTVHDVLGIVKHDKAIQAGDARRLEALVDKKVLPHFDFERMTRLAVGRAWRSANDEQRQALVTEFRTMLVRAYTKSFLLYRDQSVAVTPVSVPATVDEVTVKTVLTKTSGQPVSIDYELRRTGDGWKAFDVTIEGISMVLSYRGSFASEIQRGGVDGLIQALKDKNAQPASADAKAGK